MIWLVFAQVAKVVVSISNTFIVRLSRFAEALINVYFEAWLACETVTQVLLGRSKISMVYYRVQPEVAPVTVDLATLTAVAVPVALIS